MANLPNALDAAKSCADFFNTTVLVRAAGNGQYMYERERWIKANPQFYTKYVFLHRVHPGGRIEDLKGYTPCTSNGPEPA